MSWSGGTNIFDAVADALVDMGADRTTTRAVLVPLIRALSDNDWDTEGDSLAEFHEYPEILECFDIADWAED